MKKRLENINRLIDEYRLPLAAIKRLKGIQSRLADKIISQNTPREFMASYDEVGGQPWEIEASSIEEAMASAKADVFSWYDDVDESLTFGVTVTCPLTGERDYSEIQIDPDPPECTEDEDGITQEHDWVSPVEVVGGLTENPGVWGHGGGVIIKEVCRHCGAYRITDTWATKQSTGQVTETVEYLPADDDSLDWVAMERAERSGK